VELLAQVLGDTPGGRLHKRLVEARSWPPGPSASPGAGRARPADAGGHAGPGQDVEPAQRRLRPALVAVMAQPVTAEELERARTQWLNGWEQGFPIPR
jgi:zinc protease